MLRTLIIAIASIVLSSAAFSATLVPIQGDVSINRGSGYKRVTEPSPVVGGETVMVGLGGSAQVVYDDQCKVPVKVGYVVSIGRKSPCSKTASFDLDGTRMNAGIAPGKAFQEPPPRRHWGWVPAAAIGIVVGLCIAEEHICDNPASP